MYRSWDYYDAHLTPLCAPCSLQRTNADILTGQPPYELVLGSEPVLRFEPVAASELCNILVIAEMRLPFADQGSLARCHCAAAHWLCSCCQCWQAAERALVSPCSGAGRRRMPWGLTCNLTRCKSDT
jgi:hypothetical protein